jgi:ATP phosphoribosyltransferase
LISPDKYNYVKLALPKGGLLEPTANLLNSLGLGFDSYNNKTRLYRLESKTDSKLSAKIFQERDIPVQVAIGNYDMGICGTDWIDELTIKFPESYIIKIMNLDYDSGFLYLARSQYKKNINLNALTNKKTNWRIVSEYPNIAEHTAQNLRLKRFRIFPVYGSAEAYPPEDAEIVVLKAKDELSLKTKNLVPIKSLLRTNASLIVNKNSWQKKNLGRIIKLFTDRAKSADKSFKSYEIQQVSYVNGGYYESLPSLIYLAIPDGHQMKPASEFIRSSGIKLKGYEESNLMRRPDSGIEWLKVKVIRPQDMPTQVANGNFDIAITGHDWFLEHVYQFPTSPIKKEFDLDFGAVRVVAVVNKDMSVDNIDDIKELVSSGKLSTLRVASEYVNIADRYLHSKHMPFYKVIPTWGATEALLPEDADLLIENTQTGKTLEAHNLKIIDTLFTSTACVIINKNSINNKLKKEKLWEIIGILRK